jgi:hypothetical protein
MAGCNPYAIDTITILRDTACNILPARFKSFSGVLNLANKKTDLTWSVLNNSLANSFVIEASVDGEGFVETGQVPSNNNLPDEATYHFNYSMPFGVRSFVDFRIKMFKDDGSYAYSRVIRVSLKPSQNAGITIAPNPVRGQFQMNITSVNDVQAKISFVDMQGRIVMVMNEMLKKGPNIFSVPVGENWPAGIYNAILKINQETLTTRFVVLE